MEELPSAENVVSWYNLMVWIIVGVISGSLAGMLVKRKREGYGVLLNFGIGLVGALIGGVLFNLLHILDSLSKVQVDLQQLTAGFTGSLLFLLGLRIFKAQRAKSAGRKAKMVPGME